MGEVTIVRENDEALTIEIKSAHRVHAWLLRYELDDGYTVMGIFRRRDHVEGFVQQVIDKIRSHANWRAVNRDAVVVDVNASPEHRNLAIHRHPTSDDELFAHTPTAKAALRKNFLQPLT